MWLATQGEMRDDVDTRVAVLIDADNTPHDAIKQILDESAKFGRTIIRRAYGDWTRPNLQNWSSVFKEHSIKPIQQFQYTTRKNSTDSAMLIDAMDILHEKRVDAFILVTSDSDFTGLANRIREDGLKVVGMGRRTAPSSFVKGCDEFLFVENITAVNEVGRPGGSSEDAGENITTGRDLLIRAARNVANEDGLLTGSSLGVMLRKLDPSFSPNNYDVSKLADFIGLYPDVLAPTGKRSGVDPIYKIATN